MKSKTIRQNDLRSTYNVAYKPHEGERQTNKLLSRTHRKAEGFIMTNSQPTKPTYNLQGQRIGYRSNSNHPELSDALRSGPNEPPSLHNLWWRAVAERDDAVPLPHHPQSGSASMSTLLNILDEVLLLTSNEESPECLPGNGN
jgi:hypothetical protein